MTRRHATILLCCLLPACSRTRPPSVPDVEPVADFAAEAPPALPPLTATFDPDDIPDLGSLTLREKAGQLIMPWITGDYWSGDDSLMQVALDLARLQGVGGFVVGLGGSGLDLAAKFNALQRASRLPLLMAADLESGPSMRIRGATSFPGNMALGAGGREDDAYEVGRVVALEGRAIGVHIVFAPVVDVNNNPANPIINTRSYGEDPRRVGALGAAFVRGLREHGMMATAKHFPGHGDTDTDTHLSLPVINSARERVSVVELPPFRDVINAGVDAVMTAHIAMPALLGSDEPATMSAAALDSLLRRELGFRGLVVTDALDMGAIVTRYGAGPAAVRALAAGADILLMPTDPATAIDAVVAAVERGEVSEARLDASVARVLSAKARAGLFRRRTVDLEAVSRVVGARRSREIAAAIAERSVVLVKDSLGAVPLRADRLGRVAVVAYGDENSASLGVTFTSTLRAGGVRAVPRLRLFPSSGPASYDSVRIAANGAGTVVVLVSARPAAWRPDAVAMPAALAALVDSLTAMRVNVVTVALGSPYLLNQVPSTPAYMAAWSDAAVGERAAARALLGAAPITGTLPVSLPPWFPLGAGLRR